MSEPEVLAYYNNYMHLNARGKKKYSALQKHVLNDYY